MTIFYSNFIVCGVGMTSSIINQMTKLFGILECLTLAQFHMLRLRALLGFCGSTTGTLDNSPQFALGPCMVLGNEINLF